MQCDCESLSVCCVFHFVLLCDRLAEWLVSDAAVGAVVSDAAVGAVVDDAVVSGADDVVDDAVVSGADDVVCCRFVRQHDHHLDPTVRLESVQYRLQVFATHTVLPPTHHAHTATHTLLPRTQCCHAHIVTTHTLLPRTHCYHAHIVASERETVSADNTEERGSAIQAGGVCHPDRH